MASGPYQEQRAPSGRFLPPDPRVREPHRLTPQLALRVAVLGAFVTATGKWRDPMTLPGR